MRKIIERTIIGIFVLVILAVTWWAIDVFLNADARRDSAFAGSTAQGIRDGEIKLKAKYGRYLTFDELVSEEWVPPDFQTSNKSYKFSIDLTEHGFVIHALPQKNDAHAFSIDEKGIWSH